MKAKEHTECVRSYVYFARLHSIAVNAAGVAGVATPNI